VAVDVAFEHVERAEDPRAGRLARIGLAAGGASVVLLGLAIAFAHHWNAVTITIVGAWAAATLLALGASIGGLIDATSSRRLARWGLVLASVSILALVVAGIAFAAGSNATGACGGG
jgi:Tfp pilus assembly protein PilN